MQAAVGCFEGACVVAPVEVFSQLVGRDWSRRRSRPLRLARWRVTASPPTRPTKLNLSYALTRDPPLLWKRLRPVANSKTAARLDIVCYPALERKFVHIDIQVDRKIERAFSRKNADL